MSKKCLLCILFVFPVLCAHADWIYDSSVKTLTNSESGVVIKNISKNGTNLTIGKQASSTDTYEYGMLDFNSEAIFDSEGNQYNLVALGSSAFQNCKGITGFIAPPTLTTLNERSFQSSGIFTFDISHTTNFTTWGGAMFQDAYNLTGDIYLPDTIKSFGGWAFYKAGINSTGFSVFFGESIAPVIIDTQMFYMSNVEVVDFSKLSRIEFKGEAFREAPKLRKVLLPDNVVSMPKSTFNCHAQSYPLLEVYFKNCPFTEETITKNPFCEMFRNGDSYKVTDTDIETRDNVVIYVPRFSLTSGSPNWNANAIAWQTLAENSPKWLTDNSTPIFTLPTTPDGEGLYVTDRSKTGYTWNDAVVRVKFWDDPNQVEVDNSKPSCYEEFSYISSTNVSINANYRNLPDDATEMTVTFSAYADAEHTELVTSVSGTLTRTNTKIPLSLNNLDANKVYFFTLSCVDNQETPVQGDVSDFGAVNSWVYDPNALTLSFGGNVLAEQEVLKNVTANGLELSIGDNQTCKAEKIDFSCKIIGDYSIVSIDAFAFYNNDILCQIILPEEITEIKDSTFSNCSLLEYVEGLNVETIGTQAFNSCSALKVFNSRGIKWVKNNGFSSCTSLVDFGPTTSLTNISDAAFSACSSLDKELELTNPDLTKISRDAFMESNRIPSVIFGENVVSIGFKAFHKTYGLSNVVFRSNNVQFIDSTAFGGHGTKNDQNAAELSVYMTNVPASFKNIFAETHAQSGPTDEQIAAEETIVTMYIPYYDGVIKDATNGVAQSNKFAAHALEWQRADIPALVGDGSTFILPTDANDTGLWYNKHSNWGGYIVRIAYYNPLNQGFVIILK